MIMRRLRKRTGQHRDATATPSESRRTGRAGVPLVRRTASRRGRPRRATRTQRKEPRRHTTSGLPEVRRRPTLPTGVSVPSARAGLTALFGMGRGGTPRLKPPRISLERSQQDPTSLPHGRFRAISTGRLRASRPLHLPPIDVVVYDDPLRKSHLGDGFALRCFQRLS